jgi:hypothetical protein
VLADFLGPTLKQRKPKIKIEAKVEAKQEIKVEDNAEDDAMPQVQNPTCSSEPFDIEEFTKKRKSSETDHPGEASECTPQTEQNPKKAKVVHDPSISDPLPSCAGGTELQAQRSFHCSVENMPHGYTECVDTAKSGSAELNHPIAHGHAAHSVASDPGNAMDASSEWEGFGSE